MEEKIKAVVITVSDSRQESTDVSGVTLVGLLLSFGAEIVDKIIVSDDPEKIAETLEKMSDRSDVNLILTTGGTGLSPRDNTPEATLKVVEKLVPGIAEAIRFQTMKKTPTAILSRGVCGIRKNTLIINFPGSPNAVAECFEVIEPILKHAISLIQGKNPHCTH
jgi:molybdenum cofactor synthesis domain-containing protein